MDGARVARSAVQSGPLFSLIRTPCKRFYQAGNDATAAARFQLRNTAVYNKTLSQADVIDRMNGDQKRDVILASTRSTKIPVPPCGRTLCDNENVARAYIDDAAKRSTKTIRYRVVNIFDASGKNGSVTPVQIRRQHQVLVDAFAGHNISFDLSIVELHSTALRHRRLLFACAPASVGNGQCDKECRTQIAGDDGGDCDREEAKNVSTDIAQFINCRSAR